MENSKFMASRQKSNRTKSTKNRLERKSLFIDLVDFIKKFKCFAKL